MANVNEPTVREFVAALLKHWLSLTSGSLSIPFTVYAVYAQNPNTRYTFAVLAFAAIVVAGYDVWARERKGRVEIQNEMQQTLARLGRPELTLSLQEDMGWLTVYIRNDSGRPAVNLRADDIRCGDLVLKLKNVPNALSSGRIQCEVYSGEPGDVANAYILNCNKLNEHRFEAVELAIHYTDVDAVNGWVTRGRFFYNIDAKRFQWEKQWIEKEGSVGAGGRA